MKRKARIGRTVLFCEMGSAEEKGWGDLSKNRLKPDAKWRRARKKSASQGKKREQSLEKSPEIGFETGKGKKKSTSQGKKTSVISRKIARNRVQNGEKQEKRRFWGEKAGVGGEAKKWALLPILQYYEMAK